MSPTTLFARRAADRRCPPDVITWQDAQQNDCFRESQTPVRDGNKDAMCVCLSAQDLVCLCTATAAQSLILCPLVIPPSLGCLSRLTTGATPWQMLRVPVLLRVVLRQRRSGHVRVVSQGKDHLASVRCRSPQAKGRSPTKRTWLEPGVGLGRSARSPHDPASCPISLQRIVHT